MSLIRSEWVFAPNNSPDYTEIRVIGWNTENKQYREQTNDALAFKNEVRGECGECEAEEKCAAISHKDFCAWKIVRQKAKRRAKEQQRAGEHVEISKDECDNPEAKRLRRANSACETVQAVGEIYRVSEKKNPSKG